MLLCDAGHPRNRVSHGVNGFLTRDGIPPEELRRIGREDLKNYPSVEVRDIEVCDADRIEGGFEVLLEDGQRCRARKLLLATGLVEDLPDIPGFRHLFGRGVYNCPYCDGWENRDQPIAVYGLGRRGVGSPSRCWSGPATWSCAPTARPISRPATRPARRLRHPGDRKKVALLEGDEGLRRIVFEDGDALERKALFYTFGQREPSPLVEKLGCELTEKGVVETRSYERTNVPGLYAAGDASRRVQFAIVAAAEGAAAAFAINTELYKEDFHRRGPSMAHEIIDLKTLYEGWGRLIAFRIRLPDGRIMNREVEDHGAAVCVLPYDPERRVAMLVRSSGRRSFMRPGSRSLEAPAGMLDEDDPAACARREALEEVGLTLTRLEPVGAVMDDAGRLDRVDAPVSGPHAGPPTGPAQAAASPASTRSDHGLRGGLGELAAMVEDGRLSDLKTLALVQTPPEAA